MTSKWSATGLTLAGVGLAGIGALGAALTLSPTPISLSTGTAPTSIPVITSAFDDDRAVQAVATFASGQSLRSPTSGRITATTCRVGTAVQSGGSFASIDGAPLLSLATAVPLWRDIGPGTEGPDVVALQTELQHLGHSVVVDGDAGPATLAAVRAVLASVGAPTDRPGLPLTAVLWLPAPAVLPASCDAAPGDLISTGQSLGQLPTALDSIRIDALPTDLIPGDRMLTLGAVEVALAADGSTAAAAELARQDVLAAVGRPESGSTVTLQGTISLIDPVEVAVVPPSSVVVDGDRSCVFAAGRPVQIRVVGSQLGETFVLFDVVQPSEVDARPRNGRGCR